MSRLSTISRSLGALLLTALLAGQVDVIETPAPDAVPQLKAAGMKLVDNVTPHVWNYHLSMLEGSPWRDLRLRRRETEDNQTERNPHTMHPRLQTLH